MGVLTCMNENSVGVYDVDGIQRHIDAATNLSVLNENSPERTAGAKMIVTQLHSETRAELAELQGVSQSVYSEINPLHLPEVLSLVAYEHGLGELYTALKSSVEGVISVVDRRQFIKQQLAYHEAQIAQLQARIAQHAAESAELRAQLAQRDV